MARREFTKAVKVEIVRRATRPNAKNQPTVYCEECGAQAKVWNIDHTIPDGLETDKSRPLTAAEGKVLCSGTPGSCHGRKTPVDQRNIAKAKRRESAALRITTAPARPIQGRDLPKSAKAAARAAKGHRTPTPRKREMFADITPTRPTP